LKTIFPTLAALTAFAAHSQTQATFAAASIKASDPRTVRIMTIDFLPGGRLKIVDLPLRLIVANAYNLPYTSSRLKWSDPLLNQAFDIDAVAEPGAIPNGITKDESDQRMRLMLRELLALRFHLKMHTEMKEEPVYAIVIDKAGLKLKPAAIEPKDCGADQAKDIACHKVYGGPRSGLQADACTIADLATFVSSSSQTDRPVVDKTGLSQLFQVKTGGWQRLTSEASPAPAIPDQGRAASIFTIFKEMGLKLEPQRAPIENFTVDSVARPSEN
jgi:uncharacterized protein (TIGR03435 family)